VRNHLSSFHVHVHRDFFGHDHHLGSTVDGRKRWYIFAYFSSFIQKALPGRRIGLHKFFVTVPLLPTLDIQVTVHFNLLRRSKMSTRKITFGDRDPHLNYTTDWYQGYYNATSVHESGTLASANSLAARVTFGTQNYSTKAAAGCWRLDLNFFFRFSGWDKYFSATVTVLINLPAEPAVGFYYYGIPRSGGGSYGICFDCNPDTPNYQVIDGVNRTDNGQNPPVSFLILFSLLENLNLFR
jgi:hypothetical protein